MLVLDEAGTSAPGSPGGLLQGATLQAGHLESKFTGPLYVATPALLAEYGIKPSQIRPATDVLTMRPGLASLPGIDLVWGTDIAQSGAPSQAGSYIASPPVQTFSSLPSGTSAPNTVLTTQVVRRLHLQLIPYGWLIQAPAPLTATQISAARELAISSGATIETKSGELGLGEISDGATAFGILLALGVLVMTVGLIRSETEGDLRTLTAVGASSGIRRTIVGATAGVIGLLGAILGTAAAAITTLAWAKSSLSAVFGGIPAIDFLLILVGLPTMAAVGGWLSPAATLRHRQAATGVTTSRQELRARPPPHPAGAASCCYLKSLADRWRSLRRPVPSVIRCPQPESGRCRAGSEMSACSSASYAARCSFPAAFLLIAGLYFRSNTGH